MTSLSTGSPPHPSSTSLPIPSRAVKHKIVLLGDSNTGKTSLVLRAVRNQFLDGQRNTVGASFFRHGVLIPSGEMMQLDIWDTAGQERYKSLTTMYYRGAAGALIVFDVTCASSLDRARYWLAELRKSITSENTVMILVGNKKDLEETREISHDEGASTAVASDALYAEVSAKTGGGVAALFQLLAIEIDRRVSAERAEMMSKCNAVPATETYTLEADGDKDDKKCSC